MEKEGLVAALNLCLLVVLIASGCRFINGRRTAENEEPEQSSVTKKTETKITKDVLRERLIAKNVDFIENSRCVEKMSDLNSPISKPTIKKVDSLPCDKPNPLTIIIKITSGYHNSFKARLNNSWKEMNFDELVTELRTVFKEREKNGVFQDADSNKIEKRINLAANDADIADYDKNNITVEDFERLIDDLRKEGIDEIRIEVDSSTKTVSLGVINKKAVNLVEPTYPSAAKAVKASGQVTVQVTLMSRAMSSRLKQQAVICC